MAALRISKDVVATKRWAKENPPARLPNNGDVIIQGTRSAPRIQHSRRAVSQRAIERVFSSNRNRGRRRSLDFFLEWRAEDEPVGGKIVFLGHVREQIVADV